MRWREEVTKSKWMIVFLIFRLSGVVISMQCEKIIYSNNRTDFFILFLHMPCVGRHNNNVILNPIFKPLCEN